MRAGLISLSSAEMRRSSEMAATSSMSDAEDQFGEKGSGGSADRTPVTFESCLLQLSNRSV